MDKNFISLKSVAADVYSKEKMRDMPFEMLISLTLELMQITGCPLLFLDKEEVLEVHEHRVELPCNFYELRQIRLERLCHGDRMASPMRVIEQTHTTEYERGDNTEAVTVTRRIGSQQVAIVPQHRRPNSPMFKETTSTFIDANFHPGADLTYKVQGNIIITSIPEGYIRIAYREIASDEDGFPMIVNNASFLRALKSYIKYKWYTDLLDTGQLGQDAHYIYEKAERDYYANIAQAQNSLLDITPEKMRNITNILTDMMPRKYEHASGYNDLNKEHSLRVH
jgi:hypothetical protein